VSDVLGRDKIVRAYDALLARFSPRSFRATRLLLTDSSALLEWTMISDQLSLRGATALWTEDDGTISDLHLFLDPAAATAGAPAAFEEYERPNGNQPDAPGVPAVRAWLSALEREDDSPYVASMTTDAEVITLRGAASERGKPLARAYHKAMHAMMSDLSTSIENTWSAGPLVGVEYKITGRQKKDELIVLSLLDVVELRESKVAKVWRYEAPRR
jgi:hypothetical protein